MRGGALEELRERLEDSGEAKDAVDHHLVPLVEPVLLDLSLLDDEETDRSAGNCLVRHRYGVAKNDGRVDLADHDVEHFTAEDAVLDELGQLAIEIDDVGGGPVVARHVVLAGI